MNITDVIYLKDSNTEVTIELDVDDENEPIRVMFDTDKWLTEADANQLARFINKMRRVYNTRKF